MGLFDSCDLENLKNESEFHVFNELEARIAEFKEPICLCDECIIDMAAMALNNVKPLYRHSILGGLYAKDAMRDEKYAQSIREAVWEAITKIKKNPSHA
ncbi:MAG: late competence development ComFB family protein [Spirochaetaceae bacterium]|jgi:competence protein ComFB|nr:late competence development ComFB family protein [Spirochaetaceae bacterium]